MSGEIERFESELKSKISHKASSHQSEEGFLVKTFKFFDIYNKGSLDFNNFYRTVEKIGIIMEKEEVREIFPYLRNVEGDEINYREYSKNLYSAKSVSSFRQASSGQAYSPVKHPVVEDGAQSRTILRSGMNSVDYPLATTTHLYKPTTSAGRKSVMNPDYINQMSLEGLETNLKNPDFDAPQDSDSEYYAPTMAPNFNYGHEPKYYENNVYSKITAPKSQILYVERFREEINNRGGRGIIGLLKQFRIFDTDNSGCLDKYEFKKAVEDYEVDVHPKDLDNLFNSFDKNSDGQINYNEFVSSIVGPLNKYRIQIVERAFDKLDRDGAGEIELEDMLA